MSSNFTVQQQAYANLIVKGGINLQPGEAILIRAELGHRDLVRLLIAAAYEAGARFVTVDWHDPLSAKARYEHIDSQHLGYLPDYEAVRREEMLASGWAYIGLTGSEYPGALDDIPPELMRQDMAPRIQKLKFWQTGVMNNQISWCVAACPTTAWAQKVFPDLAEDAALEELWKFVLKACRVDQPGPLQAWAEHDARLKKVAAFMEHRQVRAIRYLDERPGPDGKANTDLTVGLTDAPAWSCGSALNAAGLPFFANIPTEEIFSSPHKDRVDGWVRTSKPGFPLEREMRDGYFRFEGGQLVEWRAEKGADVLKELFELPGARQLGEVSLVDVRSPINQSGLLFHNTLFDENAVCHIAFGQAYPEGVKGGNEMSAEELAKMGINKADAHTDLMIGVDTMSVIGICADGSEVLIMKDGKFVDEALA